MPALSKEDIRMGDTVRLRNGETIVVDMVSDRYGDRNGEYEGPWVVATGRPRERYHLSDVVGIAERNPRICEFCGNGVTSTNPELTYCRHCHYNGTAFEHRYADIVDRFREAFPDCWVGVEHTGGGCFWFAIRQQQGNLYWCVTEGEASVPLFEVGQLWGLVCRYCDDEDQARHVKVDGADHWEYEGVPILWGEIRDGMAQPTLDHDTVIDAIREDMRRVR